MLRTAAGEYYTPLHPELFGNPRREWLDAELVAAIEASDQADRLQQLIRHEHPDAVVYSFPFLRPAFAAMLLEEAGHYAKSGLENPKPNGMNNYGLLFNHIGLEPMFAALLHEYLLPITRLLFPHLGGASIDKQHAYTVHYSADTASDPEGLDIHHDSSDITFNAALDVSGGYSGSALRFCGLYSTARYRRYSFTYEHALGRAILYDGRMRHGAEPIKLGSRTNLVMWLHSTAFRASREHETGNAPAHALGAGTADPRCVSHHHDTDYCHFDLARRGQHCSADGRNLFMATWRHALQKQEYWRVGVTMDDLPRQDQCPVK